MLASLLLLCSAPFASLDTPAQTAPGGSWQLEELRRASIRIRPFESIAAVPDRNGDGIDELLFGAPNTPGSGYSARGIAVLVSGADHRELWRVEAQGTVDGLGLTVAAAGDLDGDGIPDFAIAQRWPASVLIHSGTTGVAFRVLLPPPSVPASGTFGTAMAAVGDTDGDGVGDLLVGAPGVPAGGLARSGAVFLYSGASGALIHEWTGSAIAEGFGVSVAGAGDVDGDGRPDLLVGAYFSTPNAPRGAAHLLSGATGGVLRSWYAPIGTLGFGAAVAGGEDLDGDGIPEILIGAPESIPRFGVDPDGAIFVHRGADGSLLFSRVGVVGERLGHAVAFAGDLDGNGRSELLLGGPGKACVRVLRDGGGLLRTVETAVRDSRLGVALAPRARLDQDAVPDCWVLGEGVPDPYLPAPAVHAFAGASGAELNVYSGGLAYPEAGTTVAAVGDWDGDGIEDFAVGAPGASPPHWYSSGAIVVCSGADATTIQRWDGPETEFWLGTALAALPDLDGDGLAEVAVGCPSVSAGGLASSGAVVILGSATRDVLLRLDGPVAGHGFGATLAAAGDLDGNGLGDLLVGAPYSSSQGSRLGEVTAWSLPSGKLLHRWLGTASYGFFGAVVAGGHDADGDGVPDVAISAPENAGGKVEIYSGTTGLLLTTLERPDPTALFYQVSHGVALAWIADFDGDGLADLLVGSDADRVGAAHCGYASIHSGRTGAILFDVWAEGYYDLLGRAVAATGDLDGDGVPDWALTALGRFAPGTYASFGMVELHSGADGALLAELVPGETNSSFGGALCGIGDRDGDGLADLLIGASRLGGGAGGVFRASLDPYLRLDRETCSAATGGPVDLGLAFPPSEAGQLYKLLASASGRGPTMVAGISVPLEADGVFAVSASPRAGSFLWPHWGRLDGQGRARARLAFPPGALLPYVGRSLDLAAITGSDPNTGRMSSAARRVVILP